MSSDASPPASQLSCFRCLDKVRVIFTLALSHWVMPDPGWIQYGSGFYLGHRLNHELLSTDWIQAAWVVSPLQLSTV